MSEIIFHLDDSKNLRGGERQVLYLAEALHKKGIKNYIVARKNSPLIEKAALKALPNFTLPYFFEWDIISAIKLYRKIKLICGQNYTPILHAHTGHTPAIAKLASIFLKCPIVIHRRVDFPLNKNPFTKFKYSSASKIIALSQAIKSILIKDGLEEKKIIVIPSSFRLEEKEKIISMRKTLETNFSLPKNAFLVGMTGALGPDKDPLNFIRAAAICLEKDNRIFFFLAGEGPLEKECEKEIKKLGIENNFKLLGQVEENISFLKALDIFVLSSKEEGLGSAIIEAMACGLPIAATKAGGIPELVKDGVNGLLAEKENPKDLAKAISTIKENHELRKNFSAASLERAKDFLPEAMAEKTLKVYEEAIKDFKSN